MTRSSTATSRASWANWGGEMALGFSARRIRSPRSIIRSARIPVAPSSAKAASSSGSETAIPNRSCIATRSLVIASRSSSFSTRDRRVNQAIDSRYSRLLRWRSAISGRGGPNRLPRE